MLWEGLAPPSAYPEIEAEAGYGEVLRTPPRLTRRCARRSVGQGVWLGGVEAQAVASDIPIHLSAWKGFSANFALVNVLAGRAVYK